MAACSASFFCRDDFDVALAILRFYGYGAHASEAAGKIAMDEKIIANAPCGL